MQNYLTDRKFKLRFSAILSEKYDQEVGVCLLSRANFGPDASATVAVDNCRL